MPEAIRVFRVELAFGLTNLDPKRNDCYLLDWRKQFHGERSIGTYRFCVGDLIVLYESAPPLLVHCRANRSINRVDSPRVDKLEELRAMRALREKV